jgi:hypothetical protein
MATTNPPPTIDGMDFRTKFLEVLIGNNMPRLFEMADDGWNKDGRGSVICMFGIDENGNRIKDNESGRASDEFDFSYMKLDEVKKMFGSDRQYIIDATEKYHHKTEAVFIILIDVKSQLTPFIAQLVLRREAI